MCVFEQQGNVKFSTSVVEFGSWPFKIELLFPSSIIHARFHIQSICHPCLPVNGIHIKLPSTLTHSRVERRPYLLIPFQTNSEVASFTIPFGGIGTFASGELKSCNFNGVPIFSPPSTPGNSSPNIFNHCLSFLG